MPSLSELNHPLRGNIILDTTDSKTWSEDAQSHPGHVFRDHAVHRFTERSAFLTKHRAFRPKTHAANLQISGPNFAI